MKRILIDSCFWIAFYTPTDSFHNKAQELSELFEDYHIIIPWPTLYEFVNTKLAKNKNNLIGFEQFLRQPNVDRLSDEEYKAPALESVFKININRNVKISLVDEVLRQMIQDANLHFDYLLTFNRVDFDYPCQRAGVQIIDENFF